MPSQETTGWLWLLSNLSKAPRRKDVMYSHINVLCHLSQPLFTYIWKNSHLIHFIISIKMTFHPWQCKKHTNFLLSLYRGKQNLFTLRANLGSSCLSPKLSSMVVKMGWTGWSLWHNVLCTCGWKWGKGFLTITFWTCLKQLSVENQK